MSPGMPRGEVTVINLYGYFQRIGWDQKEHDGYLAEQKARKAAKNAASKKSKKK